MRLQIDALNWEKEYVKNRLAGVRAAIKANPTGNRAANDLEAEACERLLDQIMSCCATSRRNIIPGRTIWRLKGRLRALQRRTGTLVRRVNSRIRRTTPLFSDDELFAHTRVVQADAIEHVIDRLYEEMGRRHVQHRALLRPAVDYRRSESAPRARPNMRISAEAQNRPRRSSAKATARAGRDPGHVRGGRHHARAKQAAATQRVCDERGCGRADLTRVARSGYTFPSHVHRA